MSGNGAVEWVADRLGRHDEPIRPSMRQEKEAVARCERSKIHRLVMTITPATLIWVAGGALALPGDLGTTVEDFFQHVELQLPLQSSRLAFPKFLFVKF